MQPFVIDNDRITAAEALTALFNRCAGGPIDTCRVDLHFGTDSDIGPEKLDPLDLLPLPELDEEPELACPA